MKNAPAPVKTETPRDLAAEAESILSINETRLNRECVRLPNQYRQAAFQAAEADRDIAEIKAERAAKEAELRLKVRRTPEIYGLEKITEAAINEIVISHARIRKIDIRLRRKEYQRDLLRALVSALETKKRSLTNLVELHAAGYFAEVRTPSRSKVALSQEDGTARPLPWNKKKEHSKN